MSAHRDVARNGLRSAADLFAARPHGTRARYMAGCKCFYCRRANSDYERLRQAARAAGDWDGIVSAQRAHKHLHKLSRQGIGRRAVSAATDIADSILHQIHLGTRAFIRARTERKILAVTAAARADHSLVPAGPLWRAIDALVAAGFPKNFLAHRLGYADAIQFNRRRVTAKNERCVLRLHRQLMTPAAREALLTPRAKIRAQPARIVHLLGDE